ncbi:enoyl-CoA hydratase [Georgenia subflava]|uniref:Enoyl-CoA hydratase n=1 Tax=Georgenia subflava TaxID=1622177 RepID=A0A6N7EGE1_9MICO|nr:enoyl-CoA hydratase [Georgenia subflava]
MPVVTYVVDGGVATITLDSPANRNALSAVVRRQLGEHLAAATADEAVRVVVLTHTGPAFCAGADLKESRGASPVDQGVADLPGLLLAVMSCPKPVLARIAGAARAGGTGLMAACDIVVAADDVTFAFPEVRLGLVPAVISVPLRRRMPAQPMRALFLSGEAFDAERAAALGLVDAAVPITRLDDEVDRWVTMLLHGAPRALAATKAVLAEPSEELAAELDVLGRLSAAHFSSAEGQEGLEAFAEKRAPVWTARPTR